MAIGTGSNGKDWDDPWGDDDSNISPIGSKDWLEDDDDGSISPAGNKSWLEEE